MNTDLESAQQALLNAQVAVRQGNRQAARRCAEIAAALCPDLEEPWLILAAVGSPRASVAYLERALQINPQSERARMGMHWAVDRLRRETNSTKKTPPPDKPAGGAASQSEANLKAETHPLGRKNVPPTAESDTQPMVTKRLSRTVSAASPAPTPPLFKSLSKSRLSFVTLVILAVCATAAWVFWPGNASPVLAFLHVPKSLSPGFGIPVIFDKPTYTPTFTSTFTPTETFTPTPTYTLTPTPTATFTPTETFTPTLTPVPTNTPRPRPTNTPAVADFSGRWIDVNLSQQMLYAYDGNNLVASFLVSTGVPAFPTVTGRFYIWIKLESTLMTGDGYYLPNVPYTMYFYKGYGIHGTYWHNNFGHPMSHGCVNMYTPDAEWMFNWASVGTLVNVHY
jgi:lipoprotein-anchoring transpeptidase ErfK/SrfK